MGGHSNWMICPEYDFMIDAGEGAASAIGIGRLAALKNIFITHPHWDHVAGLFQILNLRKRQDLKIPMTIWHPPSKKIDNIKNIVGSGYEWKIASPGENVRVSKNLVIEPFRVKHRNAYALGFKCFESRTRRKKEFSSLTSAEISTLVQSRKSNGLPPLEINEPYMAQIFTHTGDTEPLPASTLGHPEILIHDATYLPGLEKEAVDKGHSSLGHAMEAKKITGAQVLVGIHLSPQHKNQVPQITGVVIPPPCLTMVKFSVESGKIRLDLEENLPNKKLRTQKNVTLTPTDKEKGRSSYR